MPRAPTDAKLHTKFAHGRTHTIRRNARKERDREERHETKNVRWVNTPKHSAWSQETHRSIRNRRARNDCPSPHNNRTVAEEEIPCVLNGKLMFDGC
mmetsp:Transcript_29755/g.87024  ORF Transcript_29755/g.87024 Transcript_29755/m.87024 type:complete len:97 (+) Transcript_29755:117-407(+)